MTVHPVISASTQGNRPEAPLEPPWRIGEFFGADDAIDVLSQQTGQRGEGVVWDESLQCWTGDSATLVASLRADRRYGKPVLNTESGYEYLRGHPTEKQQVHHTDKVRRPPGGSSALAVISQPAFTARSGTAISGTDSMRPDHYSFVVRDEGAANQLGILYDFFAALPFWRMQPLAEAPGEAAVTLAEPGEVYVFYLPSGGKATCDLAGAEHTFAGAGSTHGTDSGAAPLKSRAANASNWPPRTARTGSSC